MKFFDKVQKFLIMITGGGAAKFFEPIDKTSKLTLIQGLTKSHFWTSFSAFPKKVVKYKIVAREFPYKTGFKNFSGSKIFSTTLTIFRFRFNTQSSYFCRAVRELLPPLPPDSLFNGFASANFMQCFLF